MNLLPALFWTFSALLPVPGGWAAPSVQIVQAPAAIPGAGVAGALGDLSGSEPMAQVTGALTRDFPADPGPIGRMWFVFESPQDIARSQAMIARIQEANPGLEVLYLPKPEALPAVDEDGTLSVDAAQALTRRIRAEKVDFVLGSNPEIYQTLHSARDSGFAHDIPFGFAGRRSVSVDIPRASLNPERLSDPRALPHRRYLVLSDDPSLPLPDPASSGMEGARLSLEEVLNDQRHQEGKPRVKMPSLLKLGLGLEMLLTGEADSREMRDLRRAAQRLASYLEREEIDVLVTDDPRASRLVGEMKREGYHLSLPVVWRGAEAPADPSGIQMTLIPLSQAAAPAQAALAHALQGAAALGRLPENFGAEGGVTVKDYEETVRRAMARPAGDAVPGGEIVFLLSSGNGDKKKGDMNPNGHFGMAVKNERGEYRVWTVQYNDKRGASFTGGLGSDQLTLGEYLYRLHRLPGAASQASVLGEAYVGRVWAFILRGIGADQRGAMEEKAMDLNEAHLAGKTRYEFFNKGGLINCISMGTAILRAALFRISRSDIETPADKAYELMHGFFRDLLENRFKDAQADLILFERPAHSGSTYRIPNVPLSSPFLNFTKLWREMGWWERLKTIFRRPLEFLGVPRAIRAFSESATRRVIVDPNSREPRIEENPSSPLYKLSQIPETLRRLKEEGQRLRGPRLELRRKIAERLGVRNYEIDPERVAAPENGGTHAELEADIARYKELDILQKLNSIDQILAEREESFLRLEIADPTRRFSRRLDRVRRAYKKAADYRARLARERRLPARAEVEDFDRLNEWAEKELHALRIALLNRLGPPLPQSIKSVFEAPVTAEDLADLGLIGSAAGGAGPNPGR